MSFLAKQQRRPASVEVSAAGTATKEHLNSKRPPTDAQAKTDFAYLTTDGSPNGSGYLKA